MALNTVSSDRLSTNVKTSNLGTELKGKVGENKNILHNGSFIIHQRGGTATAQGFLLDRWYAGHGGGTTTISQGTETSGTVYEKGLVNYYRITNTANSTAANAYRYVYQTIEAQNLLKSGWNYKSASAKITLSFYVRSSVAQNFYGYLRLSDSPDSRYAFETGSLSADTWTKVTKVIPGYTSANINNDNGAGMQVLIAPFWGTDYTASGTALNTWAAWNGGERAPDYATTWVGTNGATFDITGVQLEVGSVATDFEHRSYGDELRRCQRYYYRHATGADTSSDYSIATFSTYQTNDIFGMVDLPVTMRANPTLDQVTGTSYYKVYRDGGSDAFDSFGGVWSASPTCVGLNANSGTGVSGCTAGHATFVKTNATNAYLAFSAEI